MLNLVGLLTSIHLICMIHKHKHTKKITEHTNKYASKHPLFIFYSVHREKRNNSEANTKIYLCIFIVHYKQSTSCSYRELCQLMVCLKHNFCHYHDLHQVQLWILSDCRKQLSLRHELVVNCCPNHTISSTLQVQLMD